MRKTIKATQFELTPAISEYIEKKLVSPIEKILGQDDSVIVDIEVGRTTAHHKNGNVFRAEVNVNGKKINLRAEECHVDLYGAIDLVRDEISLMIEKTTKKRKDIVRRSAARIKSLFTRTGSVDSK